MKMKKAQGCVYSVVLVENTYNSYKLDADELKDVVIVKQTIATSISKLMRIIVSMSERYEFDLPLTDKLRADLCNRMPNFDFNTKSNAYDEIEYVLHIKQHAVDVGVIISADTNDENAEVVECPPF